MEIWREPMYFGECKGRSDRGKNASKASVWLEANAVGRAHQANVLEVRWLCLLELCHVGPRVQINES